MKETWLFFVELMSFYVIVLIERGLAIHIGGSLVGFYFTPTLLC